MRKTVRFTLCHLIISASTAYAANPPMLAVYVVSQPELNFGTIEAGGAGGTVTISPVNKRAIEGNITVSDKAPFMRAELKINGQPGESYRVHLPQTLYFTAENNVYGDGEYELKVTNLKSYSATAQKEGKGGTINENGEDTLYIGGVLNVPKNTLPGNYSGYIPVEVYY
jgi:hypothetical protein